MRTAPTLLLAMLTLFPIAVASAEESPDTSTAVWFDPVVVTASRSAQNLKDVPVNMTVVTEDQIKASATQTVADLLREVGGFSLLRYSSSMVGTPQLQSVSLRGLGGTSSSRALVLVDGIPLNDAFGSWVYWSRIPKDRVERIEIVRGGGATTWGSLAMAGVIQIFTKRPTERNLSLLAEGGSRGTRTLDLSAGDHLGPVQFSLGVDDFDTDGYHDTRPDQRGPVHRPSWSDHTGVKARMDYAPSPRWSTYLDWGYFAEDRLRGSPFPHSDTVFRGVNAGAGYTSGGGSEWKFDSFYQDQEYYNTSSTIAADGASETPSLDQFVPSTAFGAGAGWMKQLTEKHSLSAGADFQRIKGETNESSRYVAGRFTRGRVAGGMQDLAGAYAQEVFSPTARWRATAALRVDRVRTYDGILRETNLESGAVTRDDSFDSETETIVNPSLGLLHHFSNRTALRGAIYRAFRAANLAELYRPVRASGDIITAANPALRAERLKGAEAGLDHALLSTLTTRITGYWSEVEDPVIYVTIAEAGAVGGNIDPCGFVAAGGVCRQRENVGLLRTRGTEVEVEARPHTHWTISESWVYTDSRIMSAPGLPDLVGKRTRQVPLNQFVTRLSFSNPALLKASLIGRYVGNRYEDDLNLHPTGDFFVVDLMLARELARHYEAFLSAENLFDVDYVISEDQQGKIEVGGPFMMHLGVRLRLI